MSIRDRLTISFTIIFLGAFVLFTFFVYSLPPRTLLSEVDQDLEETTERIAEEIQVYSQRDVPLLLLPQEETNIFERATFFIVAVDEDGNVLTTSDNLDGFAEPLDPQAIREGDTGFRTREYQGQTLRVLTVPVRVEGVSDERFLLQVARVIEDYAVLNRLLLATLFIGGAAVTATVLIVTIISHRLFQPLVDIATMARQISRADDLSRRLPDSGRRDEVGDLTIALNQTLARLENLFRTQQRFLADVSHELRTPLTTIRGNMDLLRRLGGSDPELLADMEAELERMTRLVNDLLLLARADTGNLPIVRNPVELDTLFLEVYRQLSLLNKPVKIVLKGVDQMRVLGDADRLKQLILNLADNAVKYTLPGGTIYLHLYKTKRYAHLEVSDTGIGIPEEDLPYIFDRFYRVDKARTRAHGGSGLGLSIVRWIVEVHEGTINVTSKMGEGTTFHVRLPLLPYGREYSAGNHGVSTRSRPETTSPTKPVY